MEVAPSAEARSSSRGGGFASSPRASWYERRFGSGSKRVRKIGIVALARKLLIALWRYLEPGAVTEGALLKTDLRVR